VRRLGAGELDAPEHERAALALRARIVLSPAGSLTNGESAASLGVSRIIAPITSGIRTPPRPRPPKHWTQGCAELSTRP
jgi:hypothetical protein